MLCNTPWSVGGLRDKHKRQTCSDNIRAAFVPLKSGCSSLVRFHCGSGYILLHRTHRGFGGMSEHLHELEICHTMSTIIYILVTVASDANNDVYSFNSAS